MKQKLLLLFTMAFAIVFNSSAQTFTQVSSTLNVGNVYYMTNEAANADDVAYDQQTIDDLTNAGYNLTLGYPTDAGELNQVELNGYDLVVVGRNISSSQFKLVDEWNALEVPVLMTSAWVMRNSRLKYINSGSVVREIAVADSSNQDRITKALIADADDYTFKGVASVDGKMDYMTWFYDYIAYGADTFETTNNGKLLASIVDADTARANGNVLMVRWSPGVETYTGSGNTPMSYRTYMQMGADEGGDPKSFNYNQYTSASLRLMINEMNFLIRTGKTVSYMTNETKDADGVALDQQTIDDLKAAGYTNLVLTYPEDNGTINSVELNKSDVVVIGRNISSSQFKVPEAYNSVEAPILMTSAWVMRNSRLKYINSGTVMREIAVADSSNQDRITKALVANVADSAFIGVPVDADAKMDYMTWFYDYIAYGADTFETTNNGKLLASIVDADTARANGNVLMARWAPGIETYTGSGVTPVGYRTYLQMGADEGGSPKSFNFNQYTSASFDLMVNEMSYLASTYTPSTVVLGTDATLASIVLSEGTLSPDFDATVLQYSVELAKTVTTVPTVTATATDANAVIDQTDATAIPGSTIIKVTSEDEQTELSYIISFAYPVDPTDETVTPGMGTLDAAVLAAADGDTLILENGGQYDILAPLVIDKKLTIIAEEIPALPALANMPLISNMFTSIQVFELKKACDLTIIGIDVDALGGTYIFNPMTDSNSVVKLYVNRCRLHNTTDDILNDDASYTNNITLGDLYVRNSFLYDNGSGHGIYTKQYNAGNPWKFENITMWNLGQQFTWIRTMGGDATQTITFDHITGYNLSTSADNKELFGNDEKDGTEANAEADLIISFKNNLLSTQAGTNEGSLIFKNTDGNHSITINNNVLHACKPMANIGTVVLADNIEDQDPQFADAANGDFTVANTALHTAADDGKIVGAVYWMPGYVDPFDDITSGVSDRDANSNIKNVVVYPNPFAESINLSVELTEGSNVALSIFNINGQLMSKVNYGELSSGIHKLNCNTNEFNTGVYFYQIITDKGISTGKIVKN